MEKFDFKFVFSLFSAIGVVGGILSWWISRLLKDRVDSKEHSLEIKHLRESVNRLETKLESLSKEVLEIIKGK